MKATLEVLSGVVRVHDDPDAKFGDPFDVAFAFSASEGVAVLKALVSDETNMRCLANPKGRAAIKAAFRGIAIRELTWVRHAEHENDRTFRIPLS